MILGVDFGLKNIGLATSNGNFASPKEILKPKNFADAVTKVVSRINDWGVTEIVLGLTEGKLKKNILAFGSRLSTETKIPIKYMDETLSTFETALTGKMAKSAEHSKAAAVILQRYLDDPSSELIV